MSKAIISLAILAVLLIGEIRCAYQFCTSDFKASYKREIIYGIAMITPAGPFVGYFNIPDEN